MKKILLALLMLGTLFGCATSTDETGSGPTEEKNTPADYFGLHPDYEEDFQLSQGNEDYKFVNFYTEEEKELLNKEYYYINANYLDYELEKYIIATSEDGKHKYDPTKIKIKNVKNVTWYNTEEYFGDVSLSLTSSIATYEEDGLIYTFLSPDHDYYEFKAYREKDCQDLINNRGFIEDLIRKQEDIYKLKYDLKTFKIKEGFQDADFLDEEKNPYLEWVNVSIPLYSNKRDENSFGYEYCFKYEYSQDESLGWDLVKENSINGDVNKIKEDILAGKCYDLDNLMNAKIENDEIYITEVYLQSLYYLVTLEYENLEYDVIIELRK
jgi:hypothetical protein